MNIELDKLEKLLPEYEKEYIFKALLIIAINKEEFVIDKWKNINYDTLTEEIKKHIEKEYYLEHLYYYTWEHLYEKEYANVSWELRHNPYKDYIDITDVVNRIMDDLYLEYNYFIITFKNKKYYVEKY